VNWNKKVLWVIQLELPPAINFRVVIEPFDQGLPMGKKIVEHWTLLANQNHSDPTNADVRGRKWGRQKTNKQLVPSCV